MIEQLLAERAAAMAAHDGVPVGPVHVHGAANQLQAELLRARDRQLGGRPKAEAEPAPEAASPAPEPRKRRAPEVPPEPAPEEPAAEEPAPEERPAAEPAE